MTFEEYKKLAENPQFPDRPAIFKVEVYAISSRDRKNTIVEPCQNHGNIARYIA